MADQTWSIQYNGWVLFFYLFFFVGSVSVGLGFRNHCACDPHGSDGAQWEAPLVKWGGGNPRMWQRRRWFHNHSECNPAEGCLVSLHGVQGKVTTRSMQTGAQGLDFSVTGAGIPGRGLGGCVQQGNEIPIEWLGARGGEQPSGVTLVTTKEGLFSSRQFMSASLWSSEGGSLHGSQHRRVFGIRSLCPRPRCWLFAQTHVQNFQGPMQRDLASPL